MYGGDRPNGLQLHDYRARYNQVRPEPLFQSNIFTNDGKRLLPLYFQATLCEFVCQNRLINRFQESGAEGCVDLVCTIYNMLGNLILFHSVHTRTQRTQRQTRVQKAKRPAKNLLVKFFLPWRPLRLGVSGRPKIYRIIAKNVLRVKKFNPFS
jgi:hypothetical protein